MDKNNMPRHVAMILDGNGRWAKKRNLPRSLGHKAGADNLKQLSLDIIHSGVEVLSVFVFSTENFKREQEEVDYLMNLFVSMFQKEFKVYLKENIKVLFSGSREHLKKEVLDAMDEMAKQTENNTGGIVNFCLNYGGRREIVDACKKIVEEGIKASEITEELLDQYLYQSLPPVDLLIRTSGEYRISNFMLYEAAYAEYYFTDTLFPDFKMKDFELAVEAYQKRNRRFGGDHNGN